MSSHRNLLTLFPLAAVMLLAACKGAEQVCNPTDPLCGGGSPTVASIAVTSPIDSVMAVGRTAQMSAVARDASQNPVTVTFAWNSTNTGTATVNTSSGLVSAAAAGTTDIQATSGTVTGQLRIRAVNADLPGVTATLGDAFAQALSGALSATPSVAVSGLLTTCASNVTSGNVLAIDACLTSLLNVSGADGNDDALLGVLALFSAHAKRQLQL